MNYKLRDDELIRLQKEDIRKLQKLASTDIGNNSGNVGYSQKALNALAKGQTKSFRSGASRDTATHSGSKGYSAKALSSLSGGNYKAFQKESRKKVPALQKNNAKPRDKRYDKDLENFFNYRVGDFSGEVDYDPKTDTDVEKWRNVQKDIMRKHNLSESQFNKMWDDYYAEKTQKKPESKDKNYVVKRDRYDNLMQDNRLANDIKTLAEINYNNANQDATVSKEWAEEYGAKAITGGMTKQQYIDTLSRRYGLTPKELNDMALTFHSDANKEEVGEYGEGLKEFAEKHPVLGSAGSFIGTIGSGIEGMYNVLAGGITGDDRYLSNMFQTTKKSPREGAKENIKSDIGKGAYDIGMGVGDMVAGAATGSAPVILAGNTANEAQASSLERNNGVRQASAYGAAAGALDYITNKIGLDKAKKLAIDSIKSSGMKKFLLQNAAAGLGEAGENVLQDIGQSIIDNIVNGGNSELRLAFEDKVAEGMDATKALQEVSKEYAGQLAMSGAIGFGMGSAMQGGSTMLPALKGMSIMNKVGKGNSDIQNILNGDIPKVDADIENAKVQAEQAATEIENLRNQLSELKNKAPAEDFNIPEEDIDAAVAESIGGIDDILSPEEIAVLQDVVDGKYDIPETGETAPIENAQPNIDFKPSIHNADGQLLNTVKIPEYKADSNVFFNGSDTDIALAEAQEAAIIDTFNNIISDPEFNALSFKNGKQEVYVSPSTIGNGYRVSYTVDGVPTGHHDYSLDEMGELSQKLREMAGNGGEDIKIQRKSDSMRQNASGETAPVEVDPNDVIYHSGILSRLNKADTAGKMQGMRDTGYYGTGHYFVDQAHKSSIGKGTGYGDKPYSSVDISKYDNLYKADTDAKANKLHNFAQKMMRFINGYNDKYYSSDGEIDPLARDNYITDLYGQYLELFPDNHMNLADFENKLNDMRNGYEYDFYDRGDSAFTTFMKDHGYNGVDTRGTRSADTERGVVIYDLDEDSVLQSNVTDADIKNGLMNTRVRNGQPVFDPETDARLQKDIDSFAEKQRVKQEYKRIYDDSNLKQLESDIKNTKDRIRNLKEDIIPYEETMLEGGEDFQKEVDRTFKEFKRFDSDVTRQDIEDLLRSNEMDRNDDLINSRAELQNLEKQLPELEKAYEAEAKTSESAYRQAKENVKNTYATERAEKNPTLTGELPRSEGTVPPKTTSPVSSDGEYGKSRVINNSAINAEIISRADLDSDPVLQEIEKYEKHSNEKTLGAAKEAVKENGDKLLNEYINNEREINSDQDVDQAFILLRNLTNQMNNGTDVSSQRNLLLSRLRKAGTKYGQSIQAFAKWNETPEGALINGERMLQEPTESWKSRNAKKVKANERVAEQLEEITKPKAENVSNGSAKPKAGNPANATSQRLNNALRLQGSDGTIGNGPKAPKTHEQHRVEVENSIRKELGSVADKFNNDDFEYLTTLVEDKVPTEIIADEIEHKLNHGEWYPIDNSKPEPKPINGKLKSALDSLVESDENLPKEELTHDEIVAQVRNTLDKESASIGDFSDDDVDYIANLIQNGATKSELADAMNTKMANGTFGISAETQTKVNQLFELADKYDPNSKEASEAKAAAYKLIADEVVQNATPFEKFEAWRYLAMLGNPKTMLRNLVGNSIFNAVTDVSNGLAATLEAGTDATVKGGKKALNKVFNTDFDTSKGITRTKALLNPAKDAGLIKASWDDAYAHKYNEVTGSKYEKSVRDSIRSQKSVFNSKWAQLYEKLTDAGVSDTAAVRTKYSTSLAGYMKANGLDAKAFDADNEYRALKEKSRSQLLTDAEKAKMDSLKETADKLEKARDYAVKQAEYATFHEDNAIAKFLTEQSQKARNSENAAVRGLGYMLEGVVPFKKTPANILRSGAEYSPLGAIKSLYETGKLVYENTGKRKGNLGDTYKVKNKFRSGERTVNKTLASDVIESWSKSLTGAGLMALGYYLKNKGVLNSGTKEEKWQDDLEGIQNYSITINGKTYTIDWAAPAVMPLLMGAEISKVKERDGLLDKNWYENIDEIAGTVNSLLDPLVETSMMQGVKDTLEEIAKANKYDDKNGGSILGSAATNMLTGYATQGLPTILGQVARTVDNTRRTSDTATDSQILAPIEKQARKMMNKIPGLSQFNPAYRDAYGRTQQNSPFNNPIGNLAYQMALPSYIRDINTTEPDKQAREVFYSEGPDGVPQLDNKVFPTWKSSVNVDGHKLSPQELETYRKDSGEANYAIRDALTKEKWFNDLSGQKKAAILNKANTLVDKIGKESVGYEQDDKNLDAYKQGLPSLFEKWHQEEVNSQITEATGLSASTNAAKEIAAEMMKGNTAKAEQMMKQATKDKKGLDTLNEKYGTEMKMSDYTEYQKKGGAEAHLQSKQAAEQAGMVNAKGNIQTEQYEKAKGKAGAQWRKLDNDLPTLTQGGLSTSAIYTYANALNTKYASTINPSEYVRQYNIMNTDKENGMTQTEVLQYLNKGNHTQEEADRLWTIYGENWKQVPALVNGTWKKKKKK